MKILCALSSVEYRAEHFSFYLTARETHHPIFELGTEKLLALYPSFYLDGAFTTTENYLYYLALFRATGLVEFRSPAVQCRETQSIVANNTAPLVDMLTKIDTIGSERIQTQLSLPRFVITPETRTLVSSPDWIRIWQENYADYRNGYKDRILQEKLAEKEAILERYIKDRLKDISSYSHILASWAALAGNFPEGLIPTQSGESIPLREYWIRIIKMAAKGEGIYSIPELDITDLIEHCEDHIDHGSIQSATLMSLLRAALSKKNSLRTLGDIDVSHTFKILRPESGVEEANMLSLILNAPKSEPVLAQYPNRLAWLKAKLAWQQAQEYYKDHPQEHPEYEPQRREGDSVAEDTATESDTSDTSVSESDTIQSSVGEL